PLRSAAPPTRSERPSSPSNQAADQLNCNDEVPDGLAQDESAEAVDVHGQMAGRECHERQSPEDDSEDSDAAGFRPLNENARPAEYRDAQRHDPEMVQRDIADVTKSEQSGQLFGSAFAFPGKALGDGRDDEPVDQGGADQGHPAQG